jgi:phage terminase small subunit
MPRPQTPPAKAALTGADKNHPERFRNRREPRVSGRGLGKPPAYLPEIAREAWATFADELPWLTHEDRGAVEVVCLMRAKIMAGETGDLPASFFGNYRMALSSLGATPVDRSKVFQPAAEEDDDPFADFGGSAH